MLFMLLDTLETDEKQKFQYLYDEYHRLLLACARQIVKSESLAEDVVQEAYIRILKNLQKIDINKRSETRAYMVKIVKNVAITYYNQYLKVGDVSLDEAIEQPQDGYVDPTWHLFNVGELAKDVKRWISLLSEEEQILLLYRIYHQWSYQQIESAFGIKASTASSKVCRARNKLIAMYEKERGELHGQPTKPQ